MISQSRVLDKGMVRKTWKSGDAILGTSEKAVFGREWKILIGRGIMTSRKRLPLFITKADKEIDGERISVVGFLVILRLGTLVSATRKTLINHNH